jgi:hypothetical protein
MEYFILPSKHLHRKLRSFSKAPNIILSKLPLLNLSLRWSHRGEPRSERHITYVRQSLSTSYQAHSDTNLTVTQGNITIHFITYMSPSCNRLRNHSCFSDLGRIDCNAVRSEKPSSCTLSLRDAI